MPGESRWVDVDMIGEYVQRGSCARRFKLDMNGRELARALPFFNRVLNPLDPVLQAVGRRRELDWESELISSGHLSLNDGPRDGEIPRLPWDLFVQRLRDCRDGERYFAREVEVCGQVGEFHLRGRIDFIIADMIDGRPSLKLIECKASRKDKTYHRIQLALYLLLVGERVRLGELNLGGMTLHPQDIGGTVVRLRQDGRAEDLLAAEMLDLSMELEDAKRLLGEGGDLDRISLSPLDDLPYRLDGRCDSCVLNVNCLPESARQRRLELLGMDIITARSLRDAGVQDLDDLANLDPRGERAGRIRSSPVFTENLEGLISKARGRSSTLQGGEGFQVLQLPTRGFGNLPMHEIGGERLVRIYLSLDYDYTEDRIMTLAAHVTSSDGELETVAERSEDGRWARLPEVRERMSDGPTTDVRGSNVIVFQENPWKGDYVQDNLSERELLTSFFERLQSCLRSVSERERFPIHFYIWSRNDMDRLFEGCTRCGPDLLDGLMQLLGCRESLEQLIYSSLQEEMNERYALGWTGRGLVVATSLKWFGKRFHWTRSVNGRPVDLDRIFHQGLFDFSSPLQVTEDGQWARMNDHQAKGRMFEVHSRFQDSLPVPYMHAVWGVLPDPDSLGMKVSVARAIRGFMKASGPGLLREYLRSRVQALRWMEERMRPKNAAIRKFPLSLSSLPDFSLGVCGPERAALDLLRLDHHVRLNQWYSRMSSAPLERVASGDCMPLSDVAVVSDATEGGAVDKYLIGKLDLERYHEHADTARDRTTLEVGSWVRLTPYDGDIFGRSGTGDLAGVGATGTIEVLDFDNRVAKVKLVGGWSNRYVLPSAPSVDGTGFVTMDESPSDHVSNRVDRRLSECGTLSIYGWFDLSAPDIPAVAPLDQREKDMYVEMLETMDLDGRHLGRDQVGAVMNGLEARVQLVQGPPGTGKTMTSAVAALMRAQVSGRNAITLIAASTHTAVDRLIGEIESRVACFTDATRKALLDEVPFVVTRLDGRIMDEGFVKTLMRSARGRHLLVGGTTNEALKLSMVAEKAAHRNRAPPFRARTLIVDEASMMVFPHFLALTTVLEDGGTIMLAGDHRQLSPILAHDWEDEDRPPVIKYQPHHSAYDAVAAIASSLDQPEGRITRSALDHTFRLPFEVREIISGLYRRDGIRLEGAKPFAIRGLSPTSDPWSSVWQDGGVFLVVHDEARSKKLNAFEADIIERIMERGGEEIGKVAVMTPHRAQRTLLRKRLAPFGTQVDIIDTVERLQGGERPTIIVSGTQSDPSSIASTAEFILDLNRTNVIFSRTMERLVVVCSRALLDSVPADADQYRSAYLWKRLRGFCDEVLQSTAIGEHRIDIQVPSVALAEEPLLSGGIEDLQELGETPEAITAYTGEPHLAKYGPLSTGIRSETLGPPPVRGMVVDGEDLNKAIESRGLSPEVFGHCLLDLQTIYGFNRLVLMVGTGRSDSIKHGELMLFESGETSMDAEVPEILEVTMDGSFRRQILDRALQDDLLILSNDPGYWADGTDRSIGFELATRSVRYDIDERGLNIGNWPGYQGL